MSKNRLRFYQILFNLNYKKRIAALKSIYTRLQKSITGLVRQNQGQSPAPFFLVLKYFSKKAIKAKAPNL